MSSRSRDMNFGYVTYRQTDIQKVMHAHTHRWAQKLTIGHTDLRLSCTDWSLFKAMTNRYNSTSNLYAQLPLFLQPIEYRCPMDSEQNRNLSYK